LLSLSAAHDGDFRPWKLHEAEPLRLRRQGFMKQQVSTPSSPGGIKLSICIATLNRAGYIGATLETIVSQLTDSVEIVILDGASSDATESIVQGIQRDCKNLRYIRRDRNQGVDQDYSLAVEFCQGDYVWLMTDDDFLVPGAIERVLREINSEPSLLIVNAEVRTADMSRLIQPRRLPVLQDLTYSQETWDEFLAVAGDYLSFIGCVVIKRSIWNCREKALYFGTLFVHVGVIFQKPLPDRILIIATPLISIRYGNAMWKPRQFEIWMFKWPELIWSLPELGERAKSSVCARTPWRNMKLLALYRAKGSYALAEYRQWIQPHLGGTWGGFLAASIALVPGSILNCGALLYSRITGHSERTGIIDLKASRFYIRNWFATH
jgi:abequosyltransferase